MSSPETHSQRPRRFRERIAKLRRENPASSYQGQSMRSPNGVPLPSYSASPTRLCAAGSGAGSAVPNSVGGARERRRRRKKPLYQRLAEEDAKRAEEAAVHRAKQANNLRARRRRGGLPSKEELRQHARVCDERKRVIHERRVVERRRRAPSQSPPPLVGRHRHMSPTPPSGSFRSSPFSRTQQPSTLRRMPPPQSTTDYYSSSNPPVLTPRSSPRATEVTPRDPAFRSPSLPSSSRVPASAGPTSKPSGEASNETQSRDAAVRRTQQSPNQHLSPATPVSARRGSPLPRRGEAMTPPVRRRPKFADEDTPRRALTPEPEKSEFLASGATSATHRGEKAVQLPPIAGAAMSQEEPKVEMEKFEDENRGPQAAIDSSMDVFFGAVTGKVLAAARSRFDKTRAVP